MHINSYFRIMGYAEMDLQVDTVYKDEDLQAIIEEELNLKEFHFEILLKSLDARKRSDIHWKLKLGVHSNELKTKNPEEKPKLSIPQIREASSAVIVGSGPAGLLAAHALCEAGFSVKLIEQGKNVDNRHADIQVLESEGQISSNSNYAFGEGGAGTFSDGKLTSRTKSIKKERRYIYKLFARLGAPEEIQYLNKPHIGSDKLRSMIKNFRKELESRGVEFIFETTVTGLVKKNNSITEVKSTAGEIHADYFFFAPGHSSFPTFRMLIESGVGFHPKGFAMGSRIEHPQMIINRIQWGHDYIDGLKAADYKLSFNKENARSVYSFCMCPGGKIVPSSPGEGSNIVNGVSDYARNGFFANSGLVAALHPREFLGGNPGALDCLNWLEKIEKKVYEKYQDFSSPAIRIQDFLSGQKANLIHPSSFPLELNAENPFDFLPKEIGKGIKTALSSFVKRMPDFAQGNLIGIETKTSCPLQVDRDENARCAGFDNLFIIGEGSGFSGGITSSAADGLKSAIRLAELLA